MIINNTLRITLMISIIKRMLSALAFDKFGFDQEFFSLDNGIEGFALTSKIFHRIVPLLYREILWRHLFQLGL